MSDGREARCWDYLDRLLSATEVERFERELLEPEMAEAFAQTLMLREMLRGVGPDEAPAALVTLLEEAVLDEVAEAHPELRRRLLGRTRAALGGLSWSLRGPQRALAGGADGTRSALNGLGNARYTLGPLANRGREQEVEPRADAKRTWWRRALRLGR